MPYIPTMSLTQVSTPTGFQATSRGVWLASCRTCFMIFSINLNSHLLATFRKSHPNKFGGSLSVVIRFSIFSAQDNHSLCTDKASPKHPDCTILIAKRIFNDEHIKKHFEKRVFLCLPEMSKTKSFVELIIERNKYIHP